MKMRVVAVMLITSLALLVTLARTDAATFKSPKECVPGKRVADSEGKTGKVVRVRETTMCDVLREDTGKEYPYLFWMLHAAGGSAETNDKLVPGKYECFADGRYTFMDVYVTGPHSYKAAGTPGTFRVEPSRKIVFESGSLKRYNAHLLDGPRIGLNTGGTFWATTCELKKR